MRVEIDESGDEMIMSLSDEDKAMLIVMGLQYCLNNGITTLHGKELSQIAAEVALEFTEIDRMH